MTGRTAAAAAARPALLLGGLIAAGLLLRLLPEGGATAFLQREAAEPGLRDALECVLLGGALCAVGIPRQVVAYVCGAAFGWWVGTCLALASQMLGCAANLAWARIVAGELIRRILTSRLARVDAALAGRPFLATLALRLLPIGSNLLLNLAAGVLRVPPMRFLSASAVGYLPQTVIFALIASGVSVGRGTQLFVGVGLFVLAGLIGWRMLQHQTERREIAPSALPRG